MSAAIFESGDTARQYVIVKPGKPDRVVWVDPTPVEIGSNCLHKGEPCPVCGGRFVYLVTRDSPEVWLEIPAKNTPGACVKCGHFVE